jgi:hypothetical protein
VVKSAFQWLLENKEWVFSGVGIAIIGAFFTGINKGRIRRGHKLEDFHEDKSSELTSKVLNVDKLLLNQLSNIFTGNAMYTFFYNLEYRIIYHDFVDRFDLAIDRFLSSDKVFRNNHLEEAKSAFLESLKELLTFTSQTFYPINGGHYKFYGGISEYEIITTFANSFEKDEEKYLQLARKVKSDWDNLQQVVREILPDYEWNE